MTDGNNFILCRPRLLPPDQWLRAAEVAERINSVNVLVPPLATASGSFLVPSLAQTPDRIAVSTTKFWDSKTRVLTVGFLDNPSVALRKKILSHMNAWGKSISLKFCWSTTEPMVRVSRTANDGHWSYMGTDILEISRHEPTMNLDSFTARTAESEFRRVVRHETGHTLGCPHEHLRKELVDLIDYQKAVDYYREAEGWDEDLVASEILTPLEDSSLLRTPSPDPHSIMCYQIPGSITKTGKPIPGGSDITESDYAFMARIYPEPLRKKERATRPTQRGRRQTSR